MADRYYIPAEIAQELSDCLAEAEIRAAAIGVADDKDAVVKVSEEIIAKLVMDVRLKVFATPIPDKMADDLEQQMDNAETGCSL